LRHRERNRATHHASADDDNVRAIHDTQHR
jgi:hypothetical protein